MKKILLLVAAVTIVVGSGAALASIPSTDGVIHGCYKTSHPAKGSVVVVDSEAGESCPSGFVPLNWNQTGPQGPAGPTGPQGPEGPQGPAGPEVHAISDFRWVTSSMPSETLNPGASSTIHLVSCPGPEYKALSGGFVWLGNEPMVLKASQPPGFAGIPRSEHEWVFWFYNQHDTPVTVQATVNVFCARATD